MAMDPAKMAEEIMNSQKPYIPETAAEYKNMAALTAFCEAVITHIIQNMQIETVVNTKGSATAQEGSGTAGMGIGAIK